MSLLEKQMKFAFLAAKLIQKAFDLGYGVTLGDAYRDPRCPYGSEVSLHRQRLAVDLNLFKRDDAGRWHYLPNTEAHAELAQYWVSLDDECTWGGEADRQDGNHYSLKHAGLW
jgi:hypothetical protein